MGQQLCRDDNKLAAIVWHYHADDVPGDAAAVELTFARLPQERGVDSVVFIS